MFIYAQNCQSGWRALWTAMRVGVICSLSLTAWGSRVESRGDWKAVCVEEGAEFKVGAERGSGVCTFQWEGDGIDFSDFSHLEVGVGNATGMPLDIRIRVTDREGGDRQYMEGRFFVAAGESSPLAVLLQRPYLEETHPMRRLLGRVRALPGGHQSNWRYLDNAHLQMVEVRVTWPGGAKAGGSIELTYPRGAGRYSADALTEKDLPDPLLDAFGQLSGEDWDGKVRDTAELSDDGERDMERHADAGPGHGLSPFGGWLDGPQLLPTGHFRVEKVHGKWWFVTPDGYLFWSLGVTGVGVGSETPFTGERYARAEEDSAAWALASSPQGLEFHRANLFRKYGAQWEQKQARVASGRIWNWGLNTIGAWSSAGIIAHRRVPYTLIISSEPNGFGDMKKVPDPFSPSFAPQLRHKLAELAHTHAGDPWNIGVFIDNELNWGSGLRLSMEVLALDESVPAKAAMVAVLKEKYGTIESLNAEWGTVFSSFSDVRSSGQRGTAAFMEDMSAYLDYHADTYYRVCKAVLKETFPDHLYLGSRFHGAIYDGRNRTVQRAASRHVDVMSYNIYKAAVTEAVLDQEQDRPILIGEFHFGTGSHGVWGYGLVAAQSLEHQAALYRIYITEAASHPAIVGAHWFRWTDHPVTGRFDGENYRIGIVSITDRPYGPLTEAISVVSGTLYESRYQH